MSRPLLTKSDRADVFRGLAHPLRREVLAHLKHKERTVGELLELLGGSVAMPTLSRHLSILRDSGLVRQQKDGHSRIYRLQRTGSQKATKWLSQLL